MRKEAVVFLIFTILALSVVPSLVVCQEVEQKEKIHKVIDLKRWIKDVELSGEIEVEAVFKRKRSKTEKTEKKNELTLSSVELGIDADITGRLSAHVILDYEQGDPIEVDEAMLHYQADAVCQPDYSDHSPWYASFGRMDIPFGYYENHFIRTPLTQKLGESKETAMVLGMYYEWINLAGGVFGGDMDETGNDNHIENYFGTIIISLPEEFLSSLEVMSGVSYISNIADSDDLTEYIQEKLAAESIQRYVDGISAFLSFQFDDRYFIEAELVNALDKFKEDSRFKPRAWNLEFAFRPVEPVELAVRYGKSTRSLQFLPESQIGVGGAYEIFNNMSLALEYQYEKYKNDEKITTVTGQFSVEF